MAVRAVLISDAEVIRRTAWIAGSNARAVLGQRLAAREVARGDLFKRRARAKLHEDASLAVPPPKARYLRVVTVEDASLGKRGRRWKAASIAMQLVALGVYQAPQERHLPTVQCSTQRIGADAIDVQDHQLALHVTAPRTPGDGRRRSRSRSRRDVSAPACRRRRWRPASVRSSGCAGDRGSPQRDLLRAPRRGFAASADVVAGRHAF